MGVFYVLHYFLLPESGTFTGGKRNTAVFLLGMFLYAVIYTVLVNLQLRYGGGVEGFLWIFRTVVAADAFAMAILYKQHYGRSILHEVRATDHQWHYDAATHSYRTKSQEELREEQEARSAEREAKRASEAARARGDQIREGKRRIRAAKVIQRWWRGRLYAPPDGILYLRARDHFAASSSQNDQEGKN